MISAHWVVPVVLGPSTDYTKKACYTGRDYAAGPTTLSYWGNFFYALFIFSPTCNTYSCKSTNKMQLVTFDRTSLATYSCVIVEVWNVLYAPFSSKIIIRHGSKVVVWVVCCTLKKGRALRYSDCKINLVSFQGSKAIFVKNWGVFFSRMCHKKSRKISKTFCTGSCFKLN